MTSLIPDTPAPAPAAPALAELVRELASARRTHAMLDASLKERKAAFLEAEKELFRLHAQEAAAVTALESRVRSYALAEFGLNPTNKKPTPGVAIQDSERLEYDVATAFVWSEALGGDLIVPASLDRKAFERVAKVARPDFVTFVPEPRVVIATDLEKAFAKAADEAAAAPEVTP
jgi:hypothetical protein